jgi:hypothetical protein
VVDHSKPYFNDKSLALWKFPVPLPKLPEDSENEEILLPYQTNVNKRKDTENAQENEKSQWQSHVEFRENISKSKEKHSHSNENISLPLPLRHRLPISKSLKKQSPE